VPQNALHKQARILSIAVHCTRAISDEDIRAGRWWWESTQRVGLHQNTKYKVRKKQTKT
jgi:phosphoadenosine phosphosulfate reductase